MTPLELLQQHIGAIEESLRVTFNNKELLIGAFVHRSFINEYKGPLSHNERLEFLGDSVLNLAVADYLYHRLPSQSEGQLSQIRSKLVDAAACAKYLQVLGVDVHILLGKGERVTAGGTKPSILADVFEALLGAIYLDAGLKTVHNFLLLHFEEVFEEASANPPRNYKAELQDLSQKKFQKTPSYKIVEESGPDHAKVFRVMVLVNDEEAGIGSGVTKKEAEQRAAFDALSKENLE